VLLRFLALSLVSLFSLSAAAGCSPEFRACAVSCEGSRLCPSGLVCGNDGFCYDSEAEAVEGACSAAVGDGGQPAVGDGGRLGDDAGVACSNAEPNNTTGTATVVAVGPATAPLGITAALCPDGDVDFYFITVSATVTIEIRLILLSLANGPSLQVLDQNSNLVESDTSVSASALEVEPTLGPGTFFIRIASTGGIQQTDYRLENRDISP
jgi:hypothetical protein